MISLENVRYHLSQLSKWFGCVFKKLTWMILYTKLKHICQITINEHINNKRTIDIQHNNLRVKMPVLNLFSRSSNALSKYGLQFLYTNKSLSQLSHHHNYYQLSTRILTMSLKVQSNTCVVCMSMSMCVHICTCVLYSILWVDHMFKMFVCFAMSTVFCHFVW